MKNYKRRCGCIYGDGEDMPWFTCDNHRANGKELSNLSVERPWWLYTLELQGDKYYVGITNRKQPYDRIRQHGGPLGAQWTKLHKPIALIDLRQIPNDVDPELEEQKQTLELMDTYGYANVRGGSLTYRGNYIKFLNHYFRDYQWKEFVSVAMTIGFLLLVILFLEINH